MKRILSLLFVFTMLVSVLASCKPAEGIGGASFSESSGNAESSSTDIPTESVPEDTKPDLGISDDLNLSGKDICIFHWDAYNPEFIVDDNAAPGDPIYDAIYKKNLYTEELLGVNMEFSSAPGDGGNMQNFTQALKNRMNDPSTPVDITSAYARTTAMVAVNGLLTDLNVYDNLDLSKEWWPKNIQNEYDINGKLYFVSGDISTNLLLMMYGVYYNAPLLENYGRDNPIELVKNDEWTIDKFIELSTNVYEDRDDSGGPSNLDFYGLASAYWDIDAMYHAAGYKLVVKDKSGENIVKYSDELFTELVGNYIDKLSEWVKLEDIATENGADHGNAFADGRSLFKIDAASAGFALRETDIDYRAVPMPKLDPAVQEDYVTCLANPFSLYGIPTSSANPEGAAAVMQTLGYYAMKYTTPAVFEVTLKGKFSKDENMISMWEYMREGISFDLGRVYHTQLGALCDFVSMAVSNGTKWSTLTTPLNIKSKERLMQNLNGTLKLLGGE